MKHKPPHVPQFGMRKERFFFIFLCLFNINLIQRYIYGIGVTQQLQTGQ